ncbi:TetR/AcrR family transcriptional regulator [Nocardia sp. NPDC003963]
MDTTSEGRDRHRGAGRPTREQARARQRELLDTALDLFLEQGYEQTTIELIAARVHMAKRTVYARYTDKASLFLAAVRRAIEAQAVPREDLENLDNGNPAETLAAIARLRIGQAMTPNGRRLHRILALENVRFPEIYTLSNSLNTGPVVAFVAEVLDRAAAAGQITTTDTDLAARAFMSMVVGTQVRSIEAGRAPSTEQLEQRVLFMVHLLFDGLRPR